MHRLFGQWGRAERGPPRRERKSSGSSVIFVVGAGPLVIVTFGLIAAGPVWGQRFLPDDPLRREPKPLPVIKPLARPINEYSDFFQNTLFEPVREQKKHHTPAPSEAVNTLGEVPDSPWFTNRTLTVAQMVEGPGTSHAPEMGKPWIVVPGKNEGITPGLVIRDEAGRKYFLKFDPMSNPEMASAADVLEPEDVHRGSDDVRRARRGGVGLRGGGDSWRGSAEDGDGISARRARRGYRLHMVKEWAAPTSAAHAVHVYIGQVTAASALIAGGTTHGGGR